MNAEITMYRCQTGERVIVFGGILAGKFAAYEILMTGTTRLSWHAN